LNGVNFYLHDAQSRKMADVFMREKASGCLLIDAC